MLSRVFVVSLLLFAAMVAVHLGALHRVGLTGSCRAATVLVDGSQWVGCTPGRISGRPSLASKSCKASELRGKVEWWHCPAPVASTAVGR